MIEVYHRLSDKEIKSVSQWLESQVKQWLTPDVSGYARGRMRAWLGVEPSLTPDAREKPGAPVDAESLHRIGLLVGWQFEFCLATYSGDDVPVGIMPHRDARFADYEARGLNVTGTCRFSYWEGRPGFSRSTSLREHDPKKDPPTHSLLLHPGDCVRFNCKNLHAAEPSSGRWNLNFWRRRGS